MIAAINTIRHHSETIRDAIDLFALDEDISKCSTQIEASIREIQAKLKYLQYVIKETEHKKSHETT